MPLAYGRLLHPRPALTNCKSYRMQHLELPHDAHKTQTYNIYMTKHSYFPYMSNYCSARYNTNRKHNIHHTPYTNILQHSKAKKTLSLTTTAKHNHCHTVTTTGIKTNMRHIHVHTSIVSRHLATRDNNKILRTPPPHISSSEEIFSRLTRRTLVKLRTYLLNVNAKSIHQHYAPSVTLTHTAPIMSSTAPTLTPHYHPWIGGETPPV